VTARNKRPHHLWCKITNYIQPSHRFKA